MRDTTRTRMLDGAPIDYAAIPLRRYLTPPESATGMLKDYVTSTAPLSTTEYSVSKAIFVLFGRAPDRAGLTYWSGVLGAGASVTTAVDTILSAVSGSYLVDPDSAAFVAQVYYHLFGKTPEEDPSGQAYWKGQLDAGTSKGAMVQAILDAVTSLTGYHVDTLRNRLLTLESVCRIQKDQAYDLSTQDSRTSVLRVVGASISYEEAMGDVHRLLIDRVASTPLSWAVTLSSSQFVARCRTPDNTTIRQHRYLVWYNRNGNMMLASAYLPPNFETVSLHRGILAFHGGGWRQGYPEKIYGYSVAFAAGTDPSYVVLTPTYRLTAYGYTAPELEEDAADFLALVKTSSYLKVDSAKVGMFGESSGGHLACWTGATQDVPRVMALYPPTDLRGNPAVSAGLDPYVDYYATDSTKQSESSPVVKWTSARTTKFQLWHGTADTFVPPSQSDALKTVVSANCTVIKPAGEGHGFSAPVRQDVIDAAILFFDERNPL